jgi:P-type Ca2+ transporter type 2B
LFYGIWTVTAFLQALIVQYGHIAFHVAKGGLNWKFWLLSIGIGSAELIVQQVLNVLFRVGSHLKINRNANRSRKHAQLSTQRLTSTEYPDGQQLISQRKLAEAEH